MSEAFYSEFLGVTLLQTLHPVVIRANCALDPISENRFRLFKILIVDPARALEDQHLGLGGSFFDSFFDHVVGQAQHLGIDTGEFR